MKKFAIIATVALTASVALASSSLDLKRVNKMIEMIIQPALTETITALGIEVNDKSNFESVETLNTAVHFNAKAEKSKWSNKATTLDADLGIKTLATNATDTKLEVQGVIGTKTEAVSLYAYAAQRALSSMEQNPSNDSLEQETLALMKDLAQTKSLNEVPAQLNKVVDLIKKVAASETQDPNDSWLKIVNSLKIETAVQGANTSAVSVKISSPISFDNISLSELALNMTKNGLSLHAKVSFNSSTEIVVSYMTQIVGFLKSVETATPDAIEDLQQMARGYVSLAEGFVKGTH